MINRNYSPVQGLDHVEDPVLVLQGTAKRYTDYATISQHHIIKGPRTNIRSCAGLALLHIMRSHILFTRGVHYHSLGRVATY
jgi:hypothetical protein